MVITTALVLLVLIKMYNAHAQTIHGPASKGLWSNFKGFRGRLQNVQGPAFRGLYKGVIHKFLTQSLTN